jgi:hypothetical protein
MARRGNNEGTIYHRPDGRWVASITVGKDDTGRQKRRSFYGRTRAEVAAKLDAALHDVRTGTYSEPTQMTVGEWLDIWLAEYVRPHLRPKTTDSYESVIRLHIKPAIGGIRLRSLQTAHVQQMITAS